MALLLAITLPVELVLWGYWSQQHATWSLELLLLVTAGLLWACWCLVPLLLTRFQRIRWRTTFPIDFGVCQHPLTIVGIGLIALAGWVWINELKVISLKSGLAVQTQSQRFSQALLTVGYDKLNPIIVVFAMILTPAITHEVMFRGFVISALRRYHHLWTIVVSAVIYALMEAMLINRLSLDRMLSMLLLGILLGWLVIRCNSLVPGILVQVLIASLQMGQVASRGGQAIEPQSLDATMMAHFPAAWLVAAAVSLLVGFWLVGRFQVRKTESATT
jgi:membrane protease YdiL (CAAX protease family)